MNDQKICDLCGIEKYDSYFYTLVIQRHKRNTKKVVIHLCHTCLMKKLGSLLPKPAFTRRKTLSNSISS